MILWWCSGIGDLPVTHLSFLLGFQCSLQGVSGVGEVVEGGMAVEDMEAEEEDLVVAAEGDLMTGFYNLLYITCIYSTCRLRQNIYPQVWPEHLLKNLWKKLYMSEPYISKYLQNNIFYM